MDKNLLECFNFFLFIFGIFFICILMLLFGFFLGGKSFSRNKNIPFESGINSIGNIYLRVPIRFSLFAILFVVFDVEVLYLYIWSVSVIEVGWIGFFEVCFFLITFFIIILYLIKTKMFNWVLSCF